MHWVSLLLGLLQSVAIFTLAVVVHATVARPLERLPGLAVQIVTGSLFGLAAFLAALSPIQWHDLRLDAHQVMVALAAPFGGPVAAVPALLVPLAYRMLSGGPGLASGVLNLVLAALLGFALGELARRRGRRFGYSDLLVLALLMPLARYVSLLALSGAAEMRGAFADFALPFAVLLPGATLAIGTLLLRDRHRRSLELELAESQRRLRLITDNAPGVLYERRLRPGGAIDYPYFSAGVEKLFGIPAAQAAAEGHRIFDRIDPADRSAVVASIEQSAATLGPWACEFRIRSGDRAVKWVRAEATPRAGRQGEVLWDGIAVDITEIKRLERELLVAREAADRANRAKSEFLASMSHELRTPLNAVLGFAQLLHYDKASPLQPRQQEYVEHIIRGGHHLLELVKDVLDLAKIESGRLRVSIERVAVASVLEEVKAALAPLAGERGVTLSVAPEPEAEPLAVRADRARLVQVLTNLVSNGIKYNRPQGTVMLSLRRRDAHWLRIEVADTGIGIPPERQGEVFQPFNRLGAERGAIEGTGVGLSICHHLVLLMGGDIGFASVLRQGSTFWVEFAAAPAEGANAVLLPQIKGSEPMPSDARPLRILYIEDNPASLALMAQLIATIPEAQMMAAPSGEVGVAMAFAHRPDLVIVDVNLPDITGYEVLERLRAAPDTAGLPVLAVSADAMPREVARGEAAGFRRYLTKPFSVPELLAAIQEAVRSQAA